MMNDRDGSGQEKRERRRIQKRRIDTDEENRQINKANQELLFIGEIWI